MQFSNNIGEKNIREFMRDFNQKLQDSSLKETI